MTITLTPGRATLADWRAVADGAGVRLDAAAVPAIEASARAVEAVISGSLMTWACYQEGTAANWIRRNLDAVLRPHIEPPRAVSKRGRRLLKSFGSSRRGSSR